MANIQKQINLGEFQGHCIGCDKPSRIIVNGPFYFEKDIQRMRSTLTDERVVEIYDSYLGTCTNDGCGTTKVYKRGQTQIPEEIWNRVQDDRFESHYPDA